MNFGSPFRSFLPILVFVYSLVWALPPLSRAQESLSKESEFAREPEFARLMDEADAAMKTGDDLMVGNLSSLLTEITTLITTSDPTPEERAALEEVRKQNAKNREDSEAAARPHFEKAATLYRKVTEQAPEIGAAWYGLGSALTRLEKTDEARPVFVKALKLYEARRKEIPNEMSLVGEMLHMQMLLGNKKATLTLVDQALKKLPDHEELKALKKSLREELNSP